MRKIFLLIYLTFILLTITGVRADANITGCGIINESGNYYLQNNILTGVTPCLTIKASDVTFEGNGYLLSALPASYNSGIQVLSPSGSENVSNVVIRNLRCDGGISPCIDIAGQGGLPPNQDWAVNITIENITILDMDGFDAIQVIAGDQIYLNYIYATGNSVLPVYIQSASNVFINNLMYEDSIPSFAYFTVDSDSFGNPTTGSISNLTFKNTNGELHFDTVSLDGLDGSTHKISQSTLFIEDSLIGVDSNANPELNVSADLRMTGLTYLNPVVYRDGVLCPPSVCSGFSYGGGIAEFSVTGFSNYTISEEQEPTYYLTLDYSSTTSTITGMVAQDTSTSLAGTTSWFPIIITIVVMVALILLVSLIIMAMRNISWNGGTA